MWRSELADLATVYALTYSPAEPVAPSQGSWEPAESTDEELPGITFGVHLEVAGKGNAQAALGYDPTAVDVDGLVVETPYGKPSLPDGVGANSKFPVTFQGKPGILTIGAAPPSGFAEVEDELGQSFTGRWVAS